MRHGVRSSLGPNFCGAWNAVLSPALNNFQHLGYGTVWGVDKGMGQLWLPVILGTNTLVPGIPWEQTFLSLVILKNLFSAKGKAQGQLVPIIRVNSENGEMWIAWQYRIPSPTSPIESAKGPRLPTARELGQKV